MKRKSDYPLVDGHNGLKVIELDGGEFAIPGGAGGGGGDGGVHVIKILRGGGGSEKHSDQENSEELNLHSN